ncbi:jerky protein homolog-like [Anastrepha obliqua]|uniref:jerky protein homolog-like n=1 Tax=Anastrepha obliqua TaxID=95512 RepID=UPI00240987DA|nr:jerky protein homolog-like [Anastrepha obliqua]
MTAAIFKDWFHRSFIPEVTKFLMKKGFPIKAFLLIDNTPSHPPEDELITEDGSILTMFMPPNATPLIQPMDQNNIRITKLYYRNSLLASVAAKGFDLLEALKQSTLKEAIVTLKSAWSNVDAVVLSKCWSNVLSVVENQEDPEDDVPLSVLRSNFIMNVEFTVFNVGEWNDDAIECNDNEIQKISDDDDDCSVKPKETITSKEAIDILNKTLKWADSINTVTTVATTIAISPPTQQLQQQQQQLLPS